MIEIFLNAIHKSETNKKEIDRWPSDGSPLYIISSNEFDLKVQQHPLQFGHKNQWIGFIFKNYSGWEW